MTASTLDPECALHLNISARLASSSQSSLFTFNLLTMSLSLQDRSPLSTTKTSIPHLGFGVYQLYGASCQAAVRAALAAGYRHFDTAQLYRNEADVGTAIQDAISAGEVKRDDVFLTTKIRAPAGSPEQTYASCADSIDKVGGKGGYVDLFLIHIPGTGRDSREELWKTLEKLHGEGRARAIGVSNYRPQHIDEMKEYATVWPPHVNQIEVRWPSLVTGDCVHKC